MSKVLCCSAKLPEDGKRNVLITSALPYVNNTPHLGNIIGSVLSADVYARYCRGRGINTLYVCGTDEYGTTTEIRALAEQVTPKQLCDKYHDIHAAVYKWFNISFDIFGRTTTELQTKIAQNIFLKLDQNEFLEEYLTTQLYCTEHSSFLADRFVEGQCPRCSSKDAQGNQCDDCQEVLESVELIELRCKLDGTRPVRKETDHMFLRLDQLQAQVESFYHKSTEKSAWSKVAKDITAAWFKKGFNARSVIRDFKWGTAVPRPGYEEKVMNPWFDACIGYVSITANYTSERERWWRDPENVQLYQFMGKDNVFYHSVMFPGSQLGTQEAWTKLHHLSATDYLTYEGGKFSISRGIGVFGDSAQEAGVPSDVWRYYLLSHRPETGDTEFDWDSFISSNNNTLLKNLGNFVSRVVKFVNSSHYNSIVPDYTQYHDPSFDLWKEEINQLLAQYINELDAVRIRAALCTVFHVSSKGNGFLQSHGLSSKLAETEPLKCAAVVGFALNLVHLIAAVIGPYIPDTAKSINAQLRADSISVADVWTADSIKPKHEIGKATYLFTNINPEKSEEWRIAFGSDEARKLKQEESAKKAKKANIKSDKSAKQAGQEAVKGVAKIVPGQVLQAAPVSTP